MKLQNPCARTAVAPHFSGPLLSFLLLLALASGRGWAADTNESPAQKERKLIAILKSDVPPSEKAIPCKLLAIYGTREAVPALARLLPNPELSSWARIALEAIPDAAADDALRAALGKVRGRLLVGVINSIGTRRDTKAVSKLIRELRDPDTEVASAAAVALGHIGGTKAAKALAKALPEAPEGVRTALAEGTILCAEKFMGEGKLAEAVKAYDLVRHADVPKQKVREAIRGAILARGAEGLPLLLEQLRSPDKAFVSIGLHTARELPGRQVSAALTAELHRADPERQPALLLALADRRDPTILPAILEAAKSGPTKLRLTAINVLDRLGELSSFPVLLEIASQEGRELSQPSVTAMVRLPGTVIDTKVMDRIPQSSGKMRQVLIEVAGLRHIDAALPLIVKSGEDPDEGVRCAVAQAIANIGGAQQAADLVRLLQKAQSAKEREEFETALIALSGRSGPGCVAHLLPLAKTGDSSSRTIGLHALASAGGPEALGAVRASVEDQDETIQDEAVRTLSTWPNNWPEDDAIAEPLLALAKSGKKESHQVLGLRGYLEYLKGDKRLKDDERASKVSELLPVVKRPEEKRLAIATIDGIPSPAVLDLLMNFATEPAIADDACSAIVKVAGKNVDALPKEQRQKALLAVVEKSQSDGTKKRAEELLKKLQ